MNNDAKQYSRRRFLSRGALAAGWLVLPRAAVGAQPGQRPPSERLNVAVVGLGARGSSDLEKCAGENIAALCDVDWRLAATTLKGFPRARKFRDFRRMLDQVPDLDAVLVSTPDHTHAVVAAAAMRRGKHVYVETPLAHSVRETRQLAAMAREAGVVTQLGNERHSGPGIRRAVEMIRGGGLGPIRQVHCWTNRPQWPQGMERAPAGAARPADLAWDLWLGPAPQRVYDPAYHPYRWRGWLDFGTGALGAMGCHLLDLAFWGLRLGDAPSFSVEATASGRHAETFPAASTICYRFPPRAGMPPVTVIWYDGGRQPPPPEKLPYGRELGSNGSLFIGERYSMAFGPTVFGTNPGQVGPRTLPEFAQVESTGPVEKIPPVQLGDWKKGNRHVLEWLEACRSGTQPCANFDYAAPLTEMVLVGNAALVAGRPIVWDRERMKMDGADGVANPFVEREYRKGWQL